MNRFVWDASMDHNRFIWRAGDLEKQNALDYDPNQPRDPEGMWTRYHVTKTKYWEKAQKEGGLDPLKYKGKKVWTSTHPVEYYNKKFGMPNAEFPPDEVELAITLPAKEFRPSKGDDPDAPDRITRVKIPLSAIKVVEQPKRKS